MSVSVSMQVCKYIYIYVYMAVGVMVVQWCNISNETVDKDIYMIGNQSNQSNEERLNRIFQNFRQNL